MLTTCACTCACTCNYEYVTGRSLCAHGAVMRNRQYVITMVLPYAH